MVEEPGQPEVLTFTPGERAHDRWLQRTVDNAGERLGRLRDRVLDSARLQRHHVVLDLNAGSGLLTWEILRRTPEGGTRALARDRQSGEALRQQSERLPELERPVVLVGDLEELADLLALRGEDSLRFDAIVGRNALVSLPGKERMLSLLGGWLQPKGCISLAETIIKHSQRLYDLLDLSPLGDDLRQRVAEAEEMIYSASDDPLVNWDASDLRAAFESAGLSGVALQEEVHETEMLVSPSALADWFSPGAARSRPSYAQHLLRRITTDELARVQVQFQRQLGGQIVSWRTRIAFVVGQI
jgi:putative ATPase